VPLAHATALSRVQASIRFFSLCHSCYYNLEDYAIKRRADGAPWTWCALSNSLQRSC